MSQNLNGLELASKEGYGLSPSSPGRQPCNSAACLQRRIGMLGEVGLGLRDFGW